MSRILGILNAYDHRNRGDRAIIEAQIAWLRTKLPEAEFRIFSPAWEENAVVFGTDVSRPPAIRTDRGTGWLANIVAPLRASWNAARGMGMPTPEFTECDAYFLCGGGYLYSSTTPIISRQLWMHAGNSLLAIHSGKPVMQFPQSWGPIDKTTDRWICRQLAEDLPVICSRGESSTRLLQDWGYGSKTIEVPDVVLALARLRPDLVRTATEGNGELGMAPIDFGFAIRRSEADLSRYIEGLVQVASSHMESGGAGVVLFPQVQVDGSDEDLPVARRLAERFNEEGLPNRLIEDASWEAYFDEVSKMSVFLGSRMHACIFALISGVPTVGLSYQPKFEALFAQLGMREHCHSITGFDALVVGELISELSHSSEYRKRVATAVGELSDQVLTDLDHCWRKSGCSALEAG